MARRNQASVTGEMIKKARKSLGETQEQFARRFGTDQGTVSYWEAGKLPRPGVTLTFLRRVLDDIGRVVRE